MILFPTASMNTLLKDKTETPIKKKKKNDKTETLVLKIFSENVTSLLERTKYKLQNQAGCWNNIGYIYTFSTLTKRDLLIGLVNHF